MFWHFGKALFYSNLLYLCFKFKSDVSRLKLKI